MQPDDALAYLNLPADELELVIGNALLARELGARPPGLDEVRAIAHRWFQDTLPQLRSTLCQNPILASLLRGPLARERNAIFTTICDLLLQHQFGLFVPVAALSAQIMHYGIEHLCPGVGADHS